MIPNHCRKTLSGQINYLGRVTSYKMRETEMGNRGSKSGISLVKEQRVDGSCCKMNKIAIKVYSNRENFLFSISQFT
jgi:hypothetical protein